MFTDVRKTSEVDPGVCNDGRPGAQAIEEEGMRLSPVSQSQHNGDVRLVLQDLRGQELLDLCLLWRLRVGE